MYAMLLIILACNLFIISQNMLYAGVCNVISALIISVLNKKISDKTPKKKKLLNYSFNMLILATFIITFSSLEIPMNFLTKSRRQYYKECYTNIRLLQNAVELYNMDNFPQMDTLDIDLLLKTEYLRFSVKCPEPDVPPYMGTHLSGEGAIYCPLHGPIKWDFKTNSESKKLYNKITSSVIVNFQSKIDTRKYSNIDKEAIGYLYPGRTKKPILSDLRFTVLALIPLLLLLSIIFV